MRGFRQAMDVTRFLLACSLAFRKLGKTLSASSWLRRSVAAVAPGPGMMDCHANANVPAGVKAKPAWRRVFFRSWMTSASRC